ncbi:hypothetical protein [Roseixanthobacter liquoris]
MATTDFGSILAVEVFGMDDVTAEQGLAAAHPLAGRLAEARLLDAAA